MARANHLLSISRTRYAFHKQGRRCADGGSLALFDRYPLPELIVHMDGPYLPTRVVEDYPEVRFVRRIEDGLYERMKPPDTAVLNDVSPDVAFQRMPDHDIEMIRRKSVAIKEADIRSARVVRIQGDAPEGRDPARGPRSGVGRVGYLARQRQRRALTDLPPRPGALPRIHRKPGH